MVILTNIFTFKSGLFMLYYISMSNMLIYPVIMNGVNIQIVLEKKIFFIKRNEEYLFLYLLGHNLNSSEKFELTIKITRREL